MAHQANATLAPRRTRHPRSSSTRISAAADVVAVVIQRVDKTCAVICRGAGFSWPSLSDAQASVERMAPSVVWRESTAGVWIARSA